MTKAFTGLACMIMSAATSHAKLLTFDMRAVRTGVLAGDQGAGQTSPNIDVTDPHAPSYQSGTLENSRIIFQLWAVFNSQNANSEALQFTQGSVVSGGSTGDFLLPGAGHLRSQNGAFPGDGAQSNNVGPFNASTSISGNFVEASSSYGGVADGVRDVGDLATNNTISSSPVQWFAADSGATTYTLPNGQTEVLIGEFALTVGAATHSGITSIRYFMRPRNTGAITVQRIQKFTLDGDVYSLNFQGVGTKNGTAFNDPNAFEIIESMLVSIGPEIVVEQPLGNNLQDGASVSFGSVSVGGNASLTFTIKNTGSADLTGLGITLDGADAAEFAVTSTPTAPVSAPNGSTTFAVLFSPTSAGTKTAQLHIASNDADENPFDLTLTGATAGSVDPLFTPNVTGNSVVATAVQPDRKTLLGGLFTAVGGQARNNLARLNPNGTLESTATFDAGTGPNDLVNSVMVQPDGKIVLGGLFSSVNGQSRNYVARLNANGSIESTATFNPGTGADNVVNGMALQADGKILLSGEFLNVNGQPRGHIARLNTNGTVESTATFNAGTGADGSVSSVAVQADGKIVIAGGFANVNGQARHGIARLNANGNVESTATFDAGSGANGVINCMVLQADGKILLAGGFTTVNGQSRGRIARLQSDGSLESTATFDPGTGANGDVYTMAVQADGKILLGGQFTSVNGMPRGNIVRLNPDGSVEDTSVFDLGSGANDYVGGVAVVPNGAILLAGGFTSVNGQSRNLIAQLANEPATQVLTVPNTTSVSWVRGGTAPEVERVTFESSTNGGASWNLLGSGTRVAGGWELTGLNVSGVGQIRARGRTSGGAYNGSSGIVEQTVAFDFGTQNPVLTAPAAGASLVSPVSVAFNLPEAALSGSVKLTFDDGITTRVLTLAASQETSGAHAFSFDIADPLASPAIASGPTLPDGTYTVTLSYRDALGNPPANSASATNVRIATTPLRLWKLIELGNANASDLGDLDGDQLVHLVEYALNLSPTIPSLIPAVSRFTYAEGQRLRMLFTRDPSRNDVTIEVQAAPATTGPWTSVATSTLGGVTSGPGYVGGDSAGGGLKTVEVRDIVNISDASQRYLRVRVTH